jgi:hypothetical protein
MFAPTSRYAGLEIVSPTRGGLTVSYVRRRFLPRSSEQPLLSEVVVVEGDRLDLIAARALGDPEQFWRVCDANDAMDPADLEATGRKLRIAVPQP